ncbi:MAG: hypothetical protein H0V98_00325 [Chloroflexia bacterium]|jgi:hypothetical protein|nr:hypothetical protein [Chloroflexia bacterium]
MQDNELLSSVVKLATDAVVDVTIAMLAVAEFVLLVRLRVNSAVLIVAGAVVGGFTTLI